MEAALKERRQVERIQVYHDIFIMVDSELCEVLDISLCGAAFTFKKEILAKLQSQHCLEIYFMNGPLLYVEDIPYTLVDHRPLPSIGSRPEDGEIERASVAFNVDKFRQIIDFHYQMTYYNARNPPEPSNAPQPFQLHALRPASS